MHCYAPNFEELEGANWFGPVFCSSNYPHPTLVRDITCITCTLMHCHAPNFEEVEGANWFGPVCLSIHLPPHPPKKCFFLFFRFGFFVKKNTYSSPSAPSPPTPPPPLSKKIHIVLPRRNIHVAFGGILVA